MATAAEILEVRNNTNTTSSQYDDTVVGELIDQYGVNCASATIWRWEWAKNGKNNADGFKKNSGGVESHERHGVGDQSDYYKTQYELYEQKCREDNGEGDVAMIKVEQPRVGGVVTEDEINELLGQ